jgi:hypothetical protein
MRQNETEGDTRALSPAQLAAIEKLLLGAKIVDAASAAGVDRRTVHRWLKGDRDFQAELNRRRNDLTMALDDHLRRIALDGLDAVEEAVRGGNVNAALAVLRGIGALSGQRQPPRIEDPDDLEQGDRTDVL